jgi:hypothetical protein
MEKEVLNNVDAEENEIIKNLFNYDRKHLLIAAIAKLIKEECSDVVSNCTNEKAITMATEICAEKYIIDFKNIIKNI